GSSIKVAILLLIVVPALVFLGRWLWRRKVSPESLAKLLDEVDEYHKLIEAIDINDQLASSGNLQSNLEDREKVIAALKLIREDLVRALKTERILRDNKKLIAQKHELLIDNLSNLQALQASSEASEYAQLLNQSLQIALDVQDQIRKLRKM
nr:hypothetical protein [Mastigocoleus sp. MO_167.B18]